MSPKPILVQKYGGSSVATPEQLGRVADLVVARKREGYGVVVVVSAMGNTTDELLSMAKSISEEPDRRELDMLLTAGERISMSLLAMAIRSRGAHAVSLTGSQSGIITTASHTNARIMEVRPFRVQDELEEGRIVIVAGFQGVSYRRDVTTLGRGGSDTTAVALAAALGAEACEIYSDVDGVLSADPRIVEDASRIKEIGYAEMQELATHGAKVLNPTAIEFAKQAGIAIYARKTGSSEVGTIIRKDVPSTQSGVRGIAHERKVAVIDARDLAPGQSQQILRVLERTNVQAKQISLSSRDGRECFSCVLSLDDVHHGKTLREQVEAIAGTGSFREDCGAVSLVGEGITRTMDVLRESTNALAELEIEIRGISTSSFRISFLLGSEDVPAAVGRLHKVLDLAHPSVEAS